MVDEGTGRTESSQHIRRADLLKLGQEFQMALSPIGTVVALLKDSNVEIAGLRRAQKRQTHATWGIMALVLITLGVVGFAVSEVRSNIRRTARIQASVSGNIKALESLSSTTKHMNASVSAAEKRALERPTMQLVPELDPVKAVKAPMKIVIEAPTPTPVERAIPGPSSKDRRMRAVSTPRAPKENSRKPGTYEIPILKESL